MKTDQKKAGVLLTYASEIVKILSGILYTPIMLRLLGQSEYGLYQLVYSVVSYLSLLSLGFGSSYVRYYSRYKAKDDKDGIAKLNGMFILIFSSISLICVICGFVLLHNSEAIFGNGLSNEELAIAKILLVLMVVNMAITFLNSVFANYITAHEEFIFQKSLILMQNICNPFLTLPILLLGYGSIGVVCVSSFLTVTVFVSNVAFCLKKLHMKFKFKQLSMSLLFDMWKFTFFIFLNQIIDQINWSVDKFLLGRMVGTTAVAVYGVGGQINNMYMQLSLAVSNVFVPKVNKIVAESNDNKELTNLMTKVGRIQFIILVLVLSGFVFVGKKFMILWAGPGYENAYMVSLLLIAPVTVALCQNVGIEIQRAKNMHKARSVVYFCIAVINVVISIPLIKMYGEVGGAIGTAFSLIVGNILFMNWYYHVKIGLNMVHYWKEIFKFLPAVSGACIFGGILSILFKEVSWSTLIIEVLSYSCVYAVFMWKIGMNETEKMLVSSIAARVKK